LDILGYFADSPILECEIARQLELQTIGRAFESGSGALILDDEEVAVRPVDVMQSY